MHLDSVVLLLDPGVTKYPYSLQHFYKKIEIMRKIKRNGICLVA